MSKFVLRKIRDGRVKIYGKYYYPNSHFKFYDGRLDGKTYAFGLYQNYTDARYPYRGVVSLWGREEAWKASYEELLTMPNGPEVMTDGSMPWSSWYSEA